MFFHLHKFFESNLRDELFAKRVSALFCGNILNQVIWASTEITFIFELTKGEDSLIDTATVNASIENDSETFGVSTRSSSPRLLSQNNHYSFVSENRAIQHRSPRYSRERLNSATANPKAQRISAGRIIIGVEETNVSFGPRFLGWSVSRQAIFPLSRVTQPRRHNSFLDAITTRRDETRRAETRRRGSRRYTRCCARWQDY